MSTGENISADFPFASRYIDVAGSRIHYIEQGSGKPVLFLHGNPTSCYLWRNIIPHLSGQARCIAPDLIGMGRSDKPDIGYGFFDHVRYIEEFIEALDLRELTFVVHDWGSALGFHYAMRHESNVRGLAFMEAILVPTPTWDDFPAEFRKGFQAFRTPEIGWEMLVTNNAFVEKVLPRSIIRPLTQEEMDHYRSPYREAASRKPLWRWPNELPIAGEPQDVVAAVSAYNAKLKESRIPKLLLHAEPGALMKKPLVDWCVAHLPNLETVDVGMGIHFIQEDHPHEIGSALSVWYRRLA